MTATVALKSRVQLYARHWFHCFSVGPKNSERVIDNFFSKYAHAKIPSYRFQGGPDHTYIVSENEIHTFCNMTLK